MPPGLTPDRGRGVRPHPSTRRPGRAPNPSALSRTLTRKPVAGPRRAPDAGHDTSRSNVKGDAASEEHEHPERRGLKVRATTSTSLARRRSPQVFCERLARSSRATSPREPRETLSSSSGTATARTRGTRIIAAEERTTGGASSRYSSLDAHRVAALLSLEDSCSRISQRLGRLGWQRPLSTASRRRR